MIKGLQEIAMAAVGQSWKGEIGTGTGNLGVLAETWQGTQFNNFS